MDVDAEMRATRGRVLGESLWRVLCIRRGDDPKDADLALEKKRIVSAAMGTFQVLDEVGFDGLDEWLELEEEYS